MNTPNTFTNAVQFSIDNDVDYALMVAKFAAEQPLKFNELAGIDVIELASKLPQESPESYLEFAANDVYAANEVQAIIEHLKAGEFLGAKKNKRSLWN